MKPRFFVPDLVLVALLAFGAGMASVSQWQDFVTDEIERAKAACDYRPHPVSDVTWDLYRRGLAPVGTAWYYTQMMDSRNGAAATCMRERLGP